MSSSVTCNNNYIINTVKGYGMLNLLPNMLKGKDISKLLWPILEKQMRYLQNDVTVCTGYPIIMSMQECYPQR